MSTSPSISDILAEVADLVQQARTAGITEGYTQAEAAFFGQNAAFLLANIFADSMEGASSRIAAHDARFSALLMTAAASMRAAVQPPSVTSKSPAAGETGVTSNATVSVRFDMDMDPATITSSTVRVAPSSGGAALDADVVYGGANRTAVLTPRNGFSAGVAYTVTLDGVHSAAGVGLLAPYTWQFTA